MNKIKFCYTFEIYSDYMLNHIDPDSVRFFMYADNGAMGDGGEIKYYCVEKIR